MTFAKSVVLFAAVASPAAAQLALPLSGAGLGNVVRGLPVQVDRLGNTATATLRSASALAEQRLVRIAALVRRGAATIERDDRGDPARRGELIAIDADPQSLANAQAAGYAMLELGTIEGTGINFARLSVPRGMSLAKAERDLKRRLPAVIVSADHLHFESGTSLGRSEPMPALSSPAPIGGTVGLIDGGVDGRINVTSARGFASGAPVASKHGTAVASTLAFAGVGRIISADVYGRDPAGGNALAIARAIGWMTALRVPVVTISLVGPSNPLLARTIAAAHSRGTIVVAAVGNDGPASPPAYPASYPDVVAVTGVDNRNRALIEAGRALHLDYAAPGADIVATGLNGRAIKVRGTSFAAPLVAARIASAYASAPDRSALIRQVDAYAVDLGAKGPDRTFGRGLLCGECRRTK